VQAHVVWWRIGSWVEPRARRMVIPRVHQVAMLHVLLLRLPLLLVLQG
jgi:hypothetical protein